MRARLGGLPLIVEDLGHITPDVIALREEIAVPGMNVVARVSDCDWRTDSVLYTSTHDSDTLAGWWQRWGRENQPQLAAGALGPADEQRALLQNVLAVENELVIIPMQDLLGLGSEARMNRPGTVGDHNWAWKLDRPTHRRAGRRAPRADSCFRPSADDRVSPHGKRPHPGYLGRRGRESEPGGGQLAEPGQMFDDRNPGTEQNRVNGALTCCRVVDVE